MNVAVVNQSEFVRNSFVMFLKKEFTQINSIVEYGENEILSIIDFSEKIDFILIDCKLLLPDLKTLVSKVHKNNSSTKIICTGDDLDPILLRTVYSSGVNCFILISEGFSKFKTAISEVLTNGFCYLYDMSETLHLNPIKHSKYHFDVSFSQKELEIIQLTRLELTNFQIGAKLGLHVKTIEFHKSNILVKTGCKKMVGAIQFLIDNKVISASLLT